MFTLKMFDSRANVVVVRSEGYESIVTHSHDFVEIGYIRGGVAENRIGNKIIPLSEGDLFVIADRNVSHSIYPRGDASKFVIENILFPFDYLKFNLSFFNPEYVYHTGKIADAEELIEKIKSEYEAKNWLYEDVIGGYVCALLAKILRATSLCGRRNIRMDENHKQLLGYIETAIRYIHYNYDKEITVNDIAANCGICTAYLQRLFRKEKNTSIKEYLIKYRIEQSCKYLLNSDYSIESIVRMVGFNDVKYFYLKFKSIVKSTPNSYRQANRKTAGAEMDEEEKNKPRLWAQGRNETDGNGSQFGR